ncbi:Solute carrier family 22 member 4 Ergothioneine transporter [Channa argus]|uniref:Solute carrier family 22 member 4 Ergothioneine transporter n=1 Tax=Channa argus TaxID=215402 RepID=A0A6G1QSD3_CHAAH|nr:Solute carrier family 22 member 4 Ergothioneine transporter [Channa argus]
MDVVRNLSALGFVPGRDVNLTDLEQESCVDGWSYSRDIYQSTVVSEFDLVCSDQWKQPFTSTVFFLGVLVGSFFSGQLSDRFGRKPVLFATMAVQTVFTFAQVFSASWTMLIIILFINGLGQISNFVAALVLGAEILTGNVRILYSSMGTCLGFAVGYMMLPLFAYFLRDWRNLLLALSLPGLAYVPLWWFIPESPRWLLSQRRVGEAETIVRKAAEWNQVQVPAVIFEDYNVDKTQTNSKEHHSVLDLLRKSSIRTTTLILCLVSFTMTIGYFGLSFNTTQLHADPYLSCFISAAVEVPAYISSWLALRYLPRQLSIICTLLLGALPLFLIQLVPQNLSHLSLALEMLGKYAITTGAALMFAYTAELYPTVLRNTATGTCTTVSRLGSCIAPFLLKLKSFGRPLPETIQQMHKRERFGRKPIFFGTMAVQTVFTFVAIFSPSWTVFCILLFISGLGQISNYISAFVLGTEILTGNVRVLFSSLGVCLAFAFGYMMLPLFAYFLRDWRSLLLALSLPGLLYLPLWWFIPESPRWLLSQGRVREAEAILREAARKNKLQAPQIIFDNYHVDADETEKQPKEHLSIFHLLKTRNIRNTTVILCMVWFTLSTGYFGLSLNTSRLHANPYISCFISAAVEVPAYISSWLALRYLPRRISVICLSELSVALEMLGKYGLTTGTYLKYLPYITLGTLAVASAFATLFLPESFGRPLPQTIQQMYRRESYTIFILYHSNIQCSPQTGF